MSDDRKDLPPVSAPNFLEKVRETLSIYMGNRGDKLDRGITLRDLTDSGIVTLRPGFLTGGGRISPIGGIGNAISGAYEPDLTPPPTPSGFAVSAAISNIFIEHAAPLYLQGHSHAKTIVYGATWVSGPLPVFGDAIKITEFTGTVFAHPTNPATTWHLWIKWVSVDGVESAAPAGGANGLVVTTGQDVATMVTAMTGPGNPFTILSVATVIDGVTYPAGTYTTKALIFDAQISTAKIKNLAVDNAKIANLSVSKLTAGAINTGDITSTGTTVVGGVSVPSWTINGSTGLATFNNVVVRGTVYAIAGTFSGDISAATGNFRGQVTGGAYTGYAWPAAGGTGFYLGPSGMLLGNANDGKYLQVEANGNIYAPGFSIVNGVMTISQVNVINTLQIANNAVTIPVGSSGVVDALLTGTWKRIISSPAITVDGTTPVMVSAVLSRISTSNTQPGIYIQAYLELDGATGIGGYANQTPVPAGGQSAVAAMPFLARTTPPAGSHYFSVMAYIQGAADGGTNIENAAINVIALKK